MMQHVVFTSCLVLLTASDVISQTGLGDFAASTSLLNNPTPKTQTARRSCVLQCPSDDYLPGTCICQSPSLFPFMFNATPCRFATCEKGKMCRMRKGKAVCVVISHDKPSIDVCNLPADPGPCEAYMPHFFFDKTDGTCKTFIYGGCQGNENRFATKPECENTCIVNVPAVVAAQTQNLGSSPVKPSSVLIGKEACHLPKEPGPCRAYVPSFFFNATIGQCQRFVYGGCRGNQNRFDSLQACQSACQGSDTPQSGSGAQTVPGKGQVLSSNRDCNLLKATGLCKAYIPSFFYNTNTGACESFVYGGCGGNANRFPTRDQCQQKCKQASHSGNSACLLPKEIGHCKARMPRYFFNQQSQMCQLFYYGGCGGNSNNFRSHAECQRQCGASTGNLGALTSPSSRPARCSQPSKSGPCFASKQRYFFNTQSGKCEMFTYGGCLGNENRFDTVDQCQAVCAPSQQPRPAGTPAGVPVDACSQPKVVGRCRAAFRRFYFNKDTGRCERFIFGGCQANQNNFRSFEACMQRCGTKVRAPSV